MAIEKYTAQQIIDKIDGSGGIKTVICQKLGCSRPTLNRYIAKYKTVARAYRAEVEKVGDVAESVVITNIRLQAELQRVTRVPVDTGDARWYLERKAKDRGYSQRAEIFLRNLDLSTLTDEQVQRIADGEDPFAVINTGAG